MLQRLLSQFRSEYPGVELDLREATSISIVRSVEEGTLDVGLVRVPLLCTSAVTCINRLSITQKMIACLERGRAEP
ncbi:LysR substrate-binding domain-containing protein [Bradyrhizobium sp. Ash2021]|uniref:LysR substrate-binding domain-containing protein n=1 Tax=Bradyrhizobium sp. Ash2021 TaxID=2954771 RepID=UPI0035BFC07D